ncbi:MAG: hypothetical protein ACK5KL_12900 [Dysgonomonas sp.]
MKHTRTYCITIISIICLACNTKHNTADQYLKEAEQIVEINPDSTLSLLDSILIPENLKGKRYYDFLLLQVKAKDKSNKNISEDTTIFDVKNYYIKNNDLDKATMASFYSGRVLEVQKKHKEAMAAYIEAESYADKTTENYNLKGLIQSYIGYLYYDQLLQDEALVRFKKAADYFQQAENYRNEAYTFRDIGSSFLLKKETDSAYYYYQKGIEIANTANDSVCQSSIRQNIGLIFRKQGNYKKSKEYLAQAIPFATNNITRAKIYSNIAQVLYTENKTDSAILYFQKSLVLLDNSDDSFLKAKIYEFLSNIEAARGNHKISLDHNKNRIENLKNIFDKNESQTILNIQKKYNYELVKNTNNKLLIQRQFLFIVLLALGLAIVVIIFLYRQKSLKKERDLFEAEQKISQLSQMAKSYDKKEDSFRSKLLHHFDILKKSALLEGFLRDDEKKHGQKLLKKFNEIVYNQASLDWNLLYQTINELHNGFFDSLRETFPQLDESEFKICCLIYSDFTNAEIAIIIGQSINTITAKRSSIRKKIGVKDYGNIVDYLNNNVKKKK